MDLNPVHVRTLREIARLLEAIGLRFEKMIRTSPDSPEDVKLYASADPGSANLRDRA